MNKITIAVVVAVVAGGLGFFGGSQYAKSSAQSALSQRFSQFSAGGMLGRRGGGGQGGGFVTGEVLSKDANSITIKLRSNSPTGQTGSKIVLTPGSTAVTKSVDGSLADVVVGDQVTVIGSTNTDGSVTAQSIQIRPATGNRN